MSECDFSDKLSAYHDQALDAETEAQVRAHLDRCPMCAAQLAQIESLSHALAPLATDLRISPIEHARIQQRLRKGLQRADMQAALYRVSAAMGLIAASILVISSAWLVDLSSRPEPRPAASRSQREWEAVAATLNAQPRPGVAGDSPYFLRYAASVQQTLQSHMPVEARHD